MSERLHQPVVVENRGGAGGNIAAGVVAHAAADGYTLLVTTTAIAINETLRETKPFSASDFKTVAIVASSPEALMTSTSNPANNLADFVKAAKGKSINFGSAGVGSGSHIEAEYFLKKIAKIDATHVPFQGGAPAINAALGNQIDLLATTLGGGAAAQITAGKLKGLGIAAEKRARRDPERADLCRIRLSRILRRLVGRLLCAGQDRPADHHRAERGNQRHHQEPGSPEEAGHDRLRPNHRIAGPGRGDVQGRSDQVGRDGQDAELVGQVAAATPRPPHAG